MRWPERTNKPQKALAAFQGTHVVYVGEPRGGICATTEMFDLLEQDFEQVLTAAIPQFGFAADRLEVHRRKSPPPQPQRHPR